MCCWMRSYPSLASARSLTRTCGSLERYSSCGVCIYRAIAVDWARVCDVRLNLRRLRSCPWLYTTARVPSLSFSSVLLRMFLSFQTALNTLKTASDKFLAQRDGKEPKERREFSLESKQDLLVPSASLEV
jgi:hypothetical protein